MQRQGRAGKTAGSGDRDQCFEMAEVQADAHSFIVSRYYCPHIIVEYPVSNTLPSGGATELDYYQDAITAIREFQ